MMNRKQNLLFLLAFPFFITSSCNPDDDVPPSEEGTTPPASGRIAATAGPLNFTTEAATARYRTTGELTISGTSTDGRKFFFVIVDFNGIQDYALGPIPANTATYVQVLNNTTTTFSAAGVASSVLSITDYDEATQQVSGTFSFLAIDVNDVTNAINVTNGVIRNVPIRTLGAAEAGKAIYYADDVYYDTRMPVVKETVLRKVNLDIEFRTNHIYNFRLPGLFADVGAVGDYDVHFNFNYDYSLDPGSFTILEYNEAEQWVSAYFSLQEWDFEMSLTKYPVTPAPLPGNGHLIMYTDTGSFESQIVNFYTTDFSGINAQLSSQFQFYFIWGNANLSYSGDDFWSKSGQTVVTGDPAISLITYWAFESDDETIRFAGENIPY